MPKRIPPRQDTALENSTLTNGFLSLEDDNRRTVMLRELFRDVAQARGGACRVGVGPRRHVILDAHCCKSWESRNDVDVHLLRCNGCRRYLLPRDVRLLMLIKKVR